MGKDKKVLTQEELQQQTRRRTAQQWIPIADIDNNIIYRKDKKMVGVLRIQPENLELLSDKEKKRRVDSLAEGFNGEKEGFQILCIGRPVDLNNYLEWLQNLAKVEHDFVKKSVLKGYIQQATKLATSGETTERRFYIIINREGGSEAESELFSRLGEFQTNLQIAELTSNICSDDEIMDVLSLFANPVQASLERTEVRFDIPTLLANKGEQ